MIAVFEALFPVFALIVVGAILKRSHFMGEDAWKGMAELCYFILYPALLIKTLSTADLSKVSISGYSATLVTTVLVMTVILLALRPVLKARGISGAAFTSLFQGVTRWHGFVALAVTGLLYGDPGLTYIALTIAIFVPFLNFINVVILSIFADQAFSMRKLVLQVLRNPFISACAFGLTLNFTGLGIPKVAYSFLDILGGGGLGLGLLTVGAGLRFSLAFEDTLMVTLGAVLRLIAMPLLMYYSASFFGIDGLARTVAMIAAAVPTAASSYVLARQMGGDAALMASIITAQVLAAIITMPAILWLAGR